MQLPLTVEQFFGVFFGVFEAYNSAVWPAQVFLLALATLTVVFIALRRPWSGVAVSVILAGHGYALPAPLCDGRSPVRGDRIQSP